LETTKIALHNVDSETELEEEVVEILQHDIFALNRLLEYFMNCLIILSSFLVVTDFGQSLMYVHTRMIFMSEAKRGGTKLFLSFSKYVKRKLAFERETKCRSQSCVRELQHQRCKNVQCQETRLARLETKQHFLLLG
jgi:hypothetical protein